MLTGHPRIAQLKTMLAARTSRDGSPLKGYAKNVAAIKDEIARLQTEMDAPEVSAQPG